MTLSTLVKNPFIPALLTLGNANRDKATQPRKQNFCLVMFVVGSAIGLGFTSEPVLASTFNAGADFSSTDNPNHVWSYGWSSTLGSGLNLFTQSNPLNPNFPSDVWSTPTIPALMAEHNGTESILFDRVHSRTFQPNQLALHPGPNGQYSLLRWEAPETGTYSLTSAFSLLDATAEGATDVHVLHNNVQLFSDFINSFGLITSSTSFNTTLSVLGGDTVDFAVGFGSNLNFIDDTTGVDVTITSVPASVPEPSSVLGLLALSSSLAVGSLLKRQSSCPS